MEHKLLILLAWPSSKPFSAPDSDDSVCLASQCVRHMNLGSGTVSVTNYSSITHSQIPLPSQIASLSSRSVYVLSDPVTSPQLSLTQGSQWLSNGTTFHPGLQARSSHPGHIISLTPQLPSHHTWLVIPATYRAGTQSSL